MKLACTVRFRPEMASASRLLPAPIRKLAILLNKTMGSGANEGTLQKTARLRNYVEYTWANVALRPWALSEPYNSREVVDAALFDWSRNGGMYVKAYKDIQKYYPVAQQSLAEYYRITFHRSAKDSKLLAAYSLDIAFRSHYVFDSEWENRNIRDSNPPPNPWRRKLAR